LLLPESVPVPGTPPSDLWKKSPLAFSDEYFPEPSAGMKGPFPTLPYDVSWSQSPVDFFQFRQRQTSPGLSSPALFFPFPPGLRTKGLDHGFPVPFPPESRRPGDLTYLTAPIPVFPSGERGFAYHPP